MGILDRLFGKKTANEDERVQMSFTEKDNIGTRHDTLSLANNYWMTRFRHHEFNEPFVVYTFDVEKDAHDALLELPCIHVAEDSGKLICTEVLIFGYYPTEHGKYEAIICGGSELTHDLWEQAKKSFIEHRGSIKNEEEPEKYSITGTHSKSNQLGEVVFVREDRKPSPYGRTYIFRIHKGPNATSALAFLKEQTVSRKLYYIVVETPEGNYGRDIDGIYKE